MAETSRSASPGASVSQASIWKNRNFLVLFFSGSIILFGGKVYELALPLILYELTHSSVVMGAMRGIELLPNLLLAMFIGVLVDRVNKRRFMLLSIFVQFVLLVGLYVLIKNGTAGVWLFYLVGFLLMTFNYSYENLRVSITKHVIPRELLTSANSKFSMNTTLLTVLGPMISGFILFLSDLKDGLLITAAAMGVAMLISLLVRMEESDAPRPNTTFLTDLKAGWQEVRRNKPLWQITTVVACTNGTAGMFLAMIVFFAKDVVGMTNYELGLVMAASGVGGFLSTFVTGWVRKTFSTGKLLGLNILALGFIYAAMYWTTSVWSIAAVLFLYGAMGTIQAIVVWTVRQESTPAEMIGRVTGLTGSIFKLAAPFTMFGSGVLAYTIGTQWVFLISGLANLLLFAVYTRLTLWRV